MKFSTKFGMKFLQFATFLCGTWLLVACSSSGQAACDPATDPNACVKPPVCTGAMQDCKNGGLDGCETDITQDVNNCGGCGMKCPDSSSGQAVCDNGVCSVATCGARFRDCNGNLQDGCETDTNRNTDNCGGCGIKCTGADHAAPICTNGQCKLACQAGYLDCNGIKSDGCELNGSADINNCGTCGNKCLPSGNTNAVCTAGSCTQSSCTAPYLTCKMGSVDTCEVDSSDDLSNCGACNKICGTVANGMPSCTASNCVIGSCDTGYDDCNGIISDGCEINTQGNPAHCGGCGMACSVDNANANCTAGKCGIASCKTGWGDCNNSPSDGCETDTTGSVSNCGACGNLCNLNHAAATCFASNCVVTVCNTGWGDCNRMASDGCETNVTNTVANCGFCGNVCAGTGQPHTDVNCQAPGTCISNCQGENYDVNNNLADGCEQADSNPPGHSQASASYLGDYSCSDGASQKSFSGKIISDARLHTSPTVESFNTSTGATPDFFSVFGDGGTFCEDDFAITFSTTGGTSATACYQLTLITNKGTYTSGIISGSSSTSFSNGSGSYSDGTIMYFKVEKVCSTAVLDVVTYNVSFHL